MTVACIADAETGREPAGHDGVCAGQSGGTAQLVIVVRKLFLFVRESLQYFYITWSVEFMRMRVPRPFLSHDTRERNAKRMAGENDMDPELLDYDEEENPPDAAGVGQNDANGAENATSKKPVKGSYVSIHSSGFRDFLLKPELLRAIVDCGFEHPSEGNESPSRLGPVSAPFIVISLSLVPRSSRRVHTAGHPGHGRSVPGKERHG